MGFSARRILRSAFRTITRAQPQAGSSKMARRVLMGVAAASVIASRIHISENERIRSFLDLNTRLSRGNHSNQPLSKSQATYSVRTTILSQNQKTRIMLLEPGDGPDMLKCHLLPISSFAQIPYEALSYQWGDTADKTCNLDCCGEDVRISATLDAALRRLRYKNGIRAIWIDAICINQDDLAERASQVRIMRDIYSNATRVLVWLGKEEKRDVLALEEITRIYRDQREPERWNNGFGWHPAPAPRSDGLLSRSEFYTTVPKHPDIQYEHIVEFLCRGYFHRAWIVQELVMARDAVLLYGEGDREISWDVFSHVIRNKLDRVVPHDILNRPKIQKSLMNIESIELARERRPLFYVLFDHAQTQSTDARDKIFAFLGLAQDWLYESNGLEPDYEVDLATLFKKVADWDRETSGSLRMLSCCSGPGNQDKQNDALELLDDTSPLKKDRLSLLRLPSWVPDWTRMGKAIPFALCEASIPFEAGTIMSGEWSVQGDVLSVRGVVVDRIDDVVKRTPTFVKTTGFYNLSDEFIDDVDNVRIWVEDCKKIASGGGLLTEDRFISFWKAMTCELTVQAKPALEEYSSKFKKYLDHIDQAPTMFRRILRKAQESKERCLKGNWEAHEDFEDLAIIETTLDRWSTGRRFFATESGLLGQAPEAARKGDLVCVLFGNEVPFIIRPKKTGYELVGECYVGGIMRGEALQGVAKKEELFRFGPWYGTNGATMPRWKL